MFELILALLGIGYYGSKVAGEKASKKYYGNKRTVYDSIEKKIRLDLGDPAYKPPETREQFWIMCESISDDLRYIFGEKWRSQLNFPLLHYYRKICAEQDVVRNSFTHPTQLAYHIWLSKKGKYHFGFYQGYNHNFCFNVHQKTQENTEITIRACKTIEKNMQLAHPDLPLRLVVNKFHPHLVCWEHRFTSLDIHDLERLW